MFLLQVGRAGRQITFDMMLQIANSLKAFHGNVEVSMIQGIDVRGQDVLRAIIIALRSGWRGPSVLDCAGSNLRDEDCNKLAEALTSRKPPRLSSINACCLNTHKTLPDIYQLRLSNNEITQTGVFYLMNSSVTFTNLSLLDLSFNCIGPAGAAYVSASIQRCSHIRSLNLSCCAIGSVGLQELSPALAKCSRIEELFLACNNIGDTGISALVQHMSGTTSQISSSFPASLRVLDLSASATSKTPAGRVVFWHGSVEADRFDIQRAIHGSTITQCGANLLAQALLNCPALQRFRIADNSLGSSGAAIIMSSLAQKTHVEHVDMTRCDITDGWDFFHHLQFCYELQSLEISGNHFDAADRIGWTARNPGLGDFANADDMVMLSNILPDLRDLREVNLSNVPMSDTALSALKASQRRCSRQVIIRVENCSRSAFNTLSFRRTLL